jgi:hypothetical protein
MVNISYFDIVKNICSHIDLNHILTVEDSFKIDVVQYSDFWYYITENGDYNDFEFISEDEVTFDLTFQNFKKIYSTFLDDQLEDHLKIIFGDKYPLFEIRFNPEKWINFRFNWFKNFLTNMVINENSDLQFEFEKINSLYDFLVDLMEEIEPNCLMPWVDLYNSKKKLINDMMNTKTIVIDLRNCLQV